jgi:hypothetical protein
MTDKRSADYRPTKQTCLNKKLFSRKNIFLHVERPVVIYTVKHELNTITARFDDI